jgi:hypothetical protein
VSSEGEGRSLFTVHIQHEQWRQESSLKVKEKEKDIVFNCVPQDQREKQRRESSKHKE